MSTDVPMADGVSRITEIRLERVFNIGNYESERIAVTATIDDDDDPVEALKSVRNWVIQQHLSSLQGKRWGT